MTALLRSQVPTHAVPVVPSDTTQITFVQLYIGTGGNVTLVTDQNETALFKNLANGSTIVQAGQKVMQTGTTATDMLAQW